MAETTLSASAFDPVVVERKAQQISRPSLSYWQDAWRRLKRNGRAIASLYIVVGMLVFTLFGPLMWRVDPAAQDLDQLSQPPWTGRSATVVAPYRTWNTSAVAPATRFMLAAPATTQAVRLTWPEVTTASGYRIYRNIFPDDANHPLGVPLGEVYGRDHTTFEDRLDLKAQRYYYAVAPFGADGAELDNDVESLPVDVARVITPEQAVEHGLVDDASTLKPGDAIELAAHPLGTDYLGRDLLARLMYGARVSLFIGIVAPFCYVLLGILYGSTAGFLGGRVDQLLMRFVDFVIALPFLLFMILFKIAFGIGPGESGILPMLVALVVLSWPGTARLVRGQILQIREEAYISASRLLGAQTGYLIMRHMIPNTLGVILVTLTFAVPSAIFTEAFLSFIGMGVAPPTPSWGSMCNDGLKTMLTHPHELIFPALAISITVLAFNLLGDGLRDALDARMRSRE
jgi:oligopeptide transport system permease protein